MAVYGDMLSVFPELFQRFDYFHMTPLPVGSYSAREDLGKVTGILQYVKDGELKRENDTLADVDIPTLWTKNKLKVGDYFITADDETFRIAEETNWSKTGNFYCYILKTFVGNTDAQQEFGDTVDLGQESYD